MAESQGFKNHTMYDPTFHFFLTPLAVGALVWTIVQLVRQPSWTTGIPVLAVVWLLVLVFKMRVYSLKVQDRIIRLEERLRLAAMLPPALQPRIGDLRCDQLIDLH